MSVNYSEACNFDRSIIIARSSDTSPIHEGAKVSPRRVNLLRILFTLSNCLLSQPTRILARQETAWFEPLASSRGSRMLEFRDFKDLQICESLESNYTLNYDELIRLEDFWFLKFASFRNARGNLEKSPKKRKGRNAVLFKMHPVSRTMHMKRQRIVPHQCAHW